MASKLKNKILEKLVKEQRINSMQDPTPRKKYQEIHINQKINNKKYSVYDKVETTPYK